ncbi:MAG: hypothetical protein IPM55_17845 [Acidobacteria bacterium]|nr:hypothetical protein [Acidobacteriota bacterium]
MDKFHIGGGKPLSGTVTISGARTLPYHARRLAADYETVKMHARNVYVGTDHTIPTA